MLNQSDFGQWKDDPMTKLLFEWVQEQKDRLEQDMLSPDVILDGTNGQLRLSNMAGMKEILDVILCLQVEDLENGKNEEG